MPPVPVVSVVVPARDAQATLGATLRALARQDFAGPMEVVMVDDASRDDTAACAKDHGVRVVPGPGRGPADARNAGVAATRGPVVAFTDADCVPTPGWLSALMAAVADADLVTGPVVPDPAARRGPFDRTLAVPGPSPRFETANLAVRRAVLDAVGGFEAFVPVPGHPELGLRPRPDQGHFGEDVVLGWRAVRAGARVAFAPGAVVEHAVFPRGPRAFVGERWRLRFFPSLVREVPELRRSSPLRVFLSPRSVRFDAALAGVLIAAGARRPWPALAAVPYVRACLRTRQPWRRSAARENLALVAADAVGLAALLCGSVAARRLVL